ncbi:hypothetical protein ACLOJK_015701 [Asimina triloba]
MGQLPACIRGLLDGKVAIITGASSGIGEAAARVFTEHGAFVIAVDILDDLGHQVVESIGSDKCCYKHCNLLDEAQVQETVAHTIEKYGRVDILFSNAGVMGRSTSIMEMDLQELDRIVAVNMRGSAAFIKHVARVMVDSQTRGSIICTASIASIVGGLSPHSYSISKHALLGLVRSAASELGKHGIRVNCISPSVVPTPMSGGGVDGWDPPMEEFVRARSNLKGIVLKPKNVAEAALFLASYDSCFVSGHNLVVDGGFTAVDHSFVPLAACKSSRVNPPCPKAPTSSNHTQVLHFFNTRRARRALILRTGRKSLGETEREREQASID